MDAAIETIELDSKIAMLREMIDFFEEQIKLLRQKKMELNFKK